MLLVEADARKLLVDSTTYVHKIPCHVLVDNSSIQITHHQICPKKNKLNTGKGILVDATTKKWASVTNSKVRFAMEQKTINSKQPIFHKYLIIYLHGFSFDLRRIIYTDDLIL